MCGPVAKKFVSIMILGIMFTIGLSIAEHEHALAQLSNSNIKGSSQNQTSIKTSANITGSIPIGPLISRSIASQIRVGLPEAAATAEKYVGTGAHSVLANLGIINGSLVYIIWIADTKSNINFVTVDAGVGKVLSANQVSITDLRREAANLGPTMMMLPGMGMMIGPIMMMGDVMMNQSESYGHSFP